MSSVSTFATGLIDHLGALGVGVGVALNGLGIPGISEVLLPLAGVAVRQGHQSLPEVVAAAFVGQMVGVSVAYVIGRYAGVVAIERYGRYVLITKHDLARSQKAFERYGGPLVMVGAFVPGIQGFIGYIGGIGTMSYRRFFAYAAIGKLIWIGLLVGLGYAVGNHVEVIDQITSKVGVVVLVAVIVGVIWYIRQQHGKSTK